MDSLEQTGISVEREIRLAADHLRFASAAMAKTSLRAEQTSSGMVDETTVFLGHRWDPSILPLQQWPNDDRLGQNRAASGADEASPNPRLPDPDSVGTWVGGVNRDEGQAMRQMTPDEIRADEATSLLERISLIDKETGPYGYRRETERIIRGRIDALRPEQTSSEEALEHLTGGRRDPGLRYRQEVENGITITREQPWRHDGAALRMTVDYQPNASESGEYRVPAYQVDQIRAIADGRASWPAVDQDTEQGTPEPPEGLAQLGELLERLDKAQNDINRVGGIEAAVRLLEADEDHPAESGLSSLTRHELSEKLARAISSFL